MSNQEGTATMEKQVLLAVAMVVVPVVILSKLIKRLLVTKSKLNLPPGPWTLPLIGSLHHVVSNPLPYRSMRELAHKHGPLMMLWMGEVPTVVASSPEAAQAITKTHDLAFADRHMNGTISIFAFDGMDLVFGSYGEQWRQLRKLCVLELLSVARVQSFQRIREEEVARFMRPPPTSAAAGDAVDLSKMIYGVLNDTIVRESIGSRCKYQDEYLDALGSSIRMAAELSLANIFPSSRLLQKLSTMPRRAMACRDRMAHIVGQIIRETKEAMDRADDDDDKTSNESLISVLLRLQKEASLPIELTDKVVMALMFDLFAAGSDTSSTTLTWCMTELIRYPATMARAQAEIREAFKEKTTITEDDLARANLRYLKCVVKEALRLHCPVPLLVPRKCRETCQVMGYDIPKDTCVFVNVWAICRDAKYWEDAEEFRPERFETTNRDYKGTDYEFLPFGSGRRMCPGVNLGVANMELALASLLYHFDWKLPSGVEPNDVDVWEAAGLVGKKNTGLLLHPVTRFAPVNA